MLRHQGPVYIEGSPKNHHHHSSLAFVSLQSPTLIMKRSYTTMNRVEDLNANDSMLIVDELVEIAETLPNMEENGSEIPPNIEENGSEMLSNNDVSAVDERPSLNMETNTDDEISTPVPEGFIDMGDHLLCGVTVYMDHVKVHIRQFKNISGSLYPTKQGITMKPGMWRICHPKLLDFKYTATDESIVVDGKLFMYVIENYNRDPLVSMQYMFNFPPQLSRTSIQLTREQFRTLTENIDIVSRIVNKLHVNVEFRSLVLNTPPRNIYGIKDLNLTVLDVERVLKRIAREYVSEEMLTIVNKQCDYDFCIDCIQGTRKRCKLPPQILKENLLTFPRTCDECILYHQNPLKHDCPLVVKTMESFDRYLMDIDVKELVDMFLLRIMNVNRSIILDYVQNLKFADILFDSYWEKLTEDLKILDEHGDEPPCLD